MKSLITKISAVLLVAGTLSACANESKEKTVETPAIEFKKEGELLLLKGQQVTAKIDIEIADSPYEWETGLMYRESMERNQGMLFIYPNAAPRSFYMKNTYIPLDIIFYSSDTTVISFKENAIPMDETSIPSNGPARFILELNTGKVAEWNIEVGDKMRFTRQ
ncbi:hypothetical protein BH23BAC2_BH23BAC2_11190 [soil metagenome]